MRKLKRRKYEMISVAARRTFPSMKPSRALACFYALILVKNRIERNTKTLMMQQTIVAPEVREKMTQDARRAMSVPQITGPLYINGEAVGKIINTNIWEL